MNTPAHSILLIDDDNAHRVLIKRAILKAGITVPILEADCLEAGRKSLFGSTTVQPAIIVIDLNLTDGRGTALVTELRNSPQHKDTHIIVLSTSALERDIEESYRAGANAYITKTDDVKTFTSELAAGVSLILSKK